MKLGDIVLSEIAVADVVSKGWIHKNREYNGDSQGLGQGRKETLVKRYKASGRSDDWEQEPESASCVKERASPLDCSYHLQCEYVNPNSMLYALHVYNFY